MAAVNRTAEFAQIVAEHQAISAARIHSRTPVATVTRSEFAAAASNIGSEIYSTADRLGRLTQLAQSVSLFDDPVQEINELTVIIKQSIGSLNYKIGQLGQMQQAMKAQRSQKVSHSTRVVESLKSQLREAACTFHDVLQTRSKNMQLLSNRRQQLTSSGGGLGAGNSSFDASASGSASSLPAPPTPVFEFVSTCVTNDSNRGGGASNTSGYGYAGGGSSSGGEVTINIPSPQQQQQMQLAQPQNSQYYDQRAVAVEAVQSTIVELGDIFQQLGVIIESQGEMLRRVDENVDDALTNVTDGHAQILKLWKNMKSNRALVLKIFAVIFFFVTIWGTFFA